MDEKQTNIVEAAIRVISRYGVKRTTMQDIADEAGIVRQTLYNTYRSKEDVLRATIEYFAETALTAVRAAWADTEDLGKKLDILFEHTIIQHYKMAHASPEAEDIISGFNDAAKDEIARARDRFRELLEEALKPHKAALTKVGLSITQYADFVEQAGHGIKKSARDPAHLKELLATLKTSVLALTGAPKAKRRA
ncbi:MAG: TetR/AcrR family transcriptional regulator [Pseudomonadota bacterium]